MTIAGGCRCGACRYAIASDAMPPVYCCHCLDCQTWSGSAFAQQAIIRDDLITIAGPVTDYSFVSPSGSTSTQYVCGTCHTRLWNANTARPGIAVIRAGTLDASDALAPRAHIWIRRKQPWIVVPDDIPIFTENAPVADFIAMMVRRG